MRKCSIIIIATVLSLGIVGGVAVYCWQQHHSGQGHHQYGKNQHGNKQEGNFFGKRIGKHLSKKLELNETQKVELKQLTQSLTTMWREGKKTFREQRIAGLNEMLSLLDANKIDQEKALNLVRDRLAMVESRAEEMISSASGFIDSLTSEQREKLKEAIEKRISKQHR